MSVNYDRKGSILSKVFSGHITLRSAKEQRVPSCGNGEKKSVKMSKEKNALSGWSACHHRIPMCSSDPAFLPPVMSQRYCIMSDSVSCTQRSAV